MQRSQNTVVAQRALLSYGYLSFAPVIGSVSNSVPGERAWSDSHTATYDRIFLQGARYGHTSGCTFTHAYR